MMATSFESATTTQAVLELEDVTSGYGRTTVLRGIDLSVKPGSVTAVLGANGAGKTTLLRTAAGALQPSAGRVLMSGDDVTRLAPHRRARRGQVSIPEGRGVFRNLTVRDNLRMSLPPWEAGTGMAPALEAFPALADRLDQVAGTMSGGQQQMLALARAFLASPSLVLVDEVSMGLSPRLVDEIFGSLRALAQSGVALLLVEQYVHRALELADQVVLLANGAFTFSGAPSEMDSDALVRSYLAGA